ncbi:MAG: hypothetical protein KF886_02430 [Candidatus Hydrogenedentes bacterium]|nr:hypothetical protein [Candidatus Hydrogenedentota bacterium]
MQIGIAGIPNDTDDIAAACTRLGLSPLYLAAIGDPHPNAAPAPIIRVPCWEAGVCSDKLRGVRLAGVWAANPALRGVVNSIAAHFGLPHMPCPETAGPPALLVPGATHLSLPDLERISDSDRRNLAFPVWVRAGCGDGDASCMRVDHPSDLSLAAIKLRGRGAGGPVRLQPAVEGAVYRLPAFKAGRDLVPFDLVAQETTTSMYRVPLGYAMPVPRRGALMEAAMAAASNLNRTMPPGWAYVELEFVDSGSGLTLVDVQCPATLDPLLRAVVRRSQGVDLLDAQLACAAGRAPRTTPRCEIGVAAAWLITRSGVVTGFQGVEEARAMPGIETVRLTAREGDRLTHVVDLVTRERGGFVMATGSTAAAAAARLAEAREKVWINTSPAVP